MTVANEQMTLDPEQVKIFPSFDRMASLNSYAIAPDTHEENDDHLITSKDIFTVIDIFLSRHEANNAVVEMQKQGLSSPQIVVISKSYQEHENSMHWEYIASDGCLVSILRSLGVNKHDSYQFLEAVDNGKFLVLGIVTDCEVSYAQHILKNIGRNVIAVY
jgi:hypothetical protein